MKSKAFTPPVFFCLILIFTSLSCQLFASPSEISQASPTLPPTAAIETTLPAQAATLTVENVPSPSPVPPTEASPRPAEESPTPPAPQPDLSLGCGEEMCISQGSFLLLRPVGQSGRITVDPSNRYGEYQRSTRSANLGSDFLNSSGVPVIAAADGKVIVASDDSKTAYANRTNIYGNLVILEHRLPGINEPLYTLYAHLSEVLVNTGDMVIAGQEIGKVGMTGNVGGSTLHFEVRLGENSPDATRNPELWLAPITDKSGELSGALAGSIQDADGNYIQMGNVVLELIAGPGHPALGQVYIKTYSDRKMRGRSPWGESFAVSELPPGKYQVSFWLGGMQQRLVEVQPGKLTVVRFNIR